MRARCMHPASVSSWLGGLKQLAPQGGMPWAQAQPLLAALADTLLTEPLSRKGEEQQQQQQQEQQQQQQQDGDRSGEVDAPVAGLEQGSGLDREPADTGGKAQLQQTAGHVTMVLRAVTDLQLDTSGGYWQGRPWTCSLPACVCACGSLGGAALSSRLLQPTHFPTLHNQALLTFGLRRGTAWDRTCLTSLPGSLPMLWSAWPALHTVATGKCWTLLCCQPWSLTSES